MNRPKFTVPLKGHSSHGETMLSANCCASSTSSSAKISKACKSVKSPLIGNKKIKSSKKDSKKTLTKSKGSGKLVVHYRSYKQFYFLF